MGAGQEIEGFGPQRKTQDFQPERIAPKGGRKRGLAGEFYPPRQFWTKSVRMSSKAYRSFALSHFLGLSERQVYLKD